jgi:Zn-dependent peptidase ImmA (M78 family)
MSFDQIKVDFVESRTNLNYSDFLSYEQGDSKKRLLADLNREGSIEYFFEGVQLKRKLCDKNAYKESINKVGFSPEFAEDTIALIEKKPLYFDFGVLENRYLNYLEEFDRFTKYDVSNIKISITFDSFVNAGVRKLNDCYLIQIYFGANFIHQWLTERKIFDYHFVREESEGRELEMYFPKENLGLADEIIKGLHARSKLILGYNNEVNVRDLEFAINSNYLIHEKTNLHETLYDKRTNILSVERFILFHEIGHIVYGHLEEQEYWSETPCKSAADLKSRLERRRSMEYEADKFAFDFLLILNSLLQGFPTTDFHRQKRFYYDYYNPVIDLFTLFHMAQLGTVDFLQESCPYPSNENRLKKLIPEDNATFMFDFMKDYLK